MSKIKNVSGEDRRVPLLGDRLVLAGQVVDVDPEQVYGFTCQAANWEPADAEAKKAHNAALGDQVGAALDGVKLETATPVEES